MDQRPTPGRSLPRSPTLKKATGQALLEYILLVVVTLGIAALIMRVLVRKDPENPGALLQRWNGINVEIGRDDPNKTR